MDGLHPGHLYISPASDRDVLHVTMGRAGDGGLAREAATEEATVQPPHRACALNARL